MLVLSRKKNESIIINDNITIVVVEIRGDARGCEICRAGQHLATIANNELLVKDFRVEIRADLDVGA